MSTKVNKKSGFHLSKETRRRLFGLSQQLLWLLDTDAKEGFKESNLSYWLGPWLHKALMLVWCHPIKAVKKSFSYLGGADCPRTIVDAAFYRSLFADSVTLANENVELRRILREHGLLNDDLPF